MHNATLIAGYRTIGAVLLALLVAAALFVGAAPAPEHTAYAAEGLDVEMAESSAQVNFPRSITFQLSAESSGAEITEVDLLYGPTRGETLTIVPVQAMRGEQIEALHTLDTQQYHLPVGVEVSYRWLLRDAEGNEYETEPEKLTYHDDRFPWEQRSERGVTVYWYEGGDRFGDELIQTATRALDRLQLQIGATVEDPVKIYIYANTADMRSALQTNSVEWVGGQAMPSLGLIIGAVAPGNTSEIERIVPHELSHQVLHQATENPYGGMPLWFEEGMAVYNQETMDAMFPQLIERAARTDQLIALEALASSFPADTNQALLSYAQSHSMVVYIVDTYGVEALEALTDAFAEATPVDEAIPEVLGLTVDELDAQWRETLPPAEVTLEQEGSREVAPPDRFTGDPVLPSSGSADPAAVAPQPMTDETPAQAPQTPTQTEPDLSTGTLIPGLGLPVWLELAVLSTGCLGMLGMTAVVLLVALRLAKSGSG